MNRVNRLIAGVSFFVAATVLASPTENEFIDCNKLAVAVLDACLKSNAEQCWSRSKASYASCREDIIQRHNRHDEHRKVKAKAEQQRIEQAKRQSTHQQTGNSQK